jgi:hypothetical protein
MCGFSENTRIVAGQGTDILQQFIVSTTKAYNSYFWMSQKEKKSRGFRSGEQLG